MNPVLEEIKAIRTRNNDLWMAIVERALQAEPITTKAILRDITANDRQISELIGKLVDG